MQKDDKTSEKEQIEELVSSVLESSKYRNVCEDLIRNIGRRELSKGQSLKAAVKATKNKLHQIGGAYFIRKPDYDSWLKKLREAKNSDENSFRDTCAEIMSYHQSSRERLKILDQFYTRIFASLPPVQSIMDVACGFNPLSIPWMPLLDGVKYYAYDVYKDLIDFINSFMTICNVRGRAEVREVIRDTPDTKADVAFLLNTIPCLEQIEKWAGLKVLEAINSNFLVVSFPVKSLCGREKNMRKHYETAFSKLTQERNWNIQKIEFITEQVFLIKK
ncbi:MAG TPA: 16S rRNA methyltransferase [Acidobacteriota bacterium]|nr:16S rRNA methyltransferase [Acidobacteriota bacterium]